jgi:hypothetical protein
MPDDNTNPAGSEFTALVADLRETAKRQDNIQRAEVRRRAVSDVMRKAAEMFGRGELSAHELSKHALSSAPPRDAASTLIRPSAPPYRGSPSSLRVEQLRAWPHTGGVLKVQALAVGSYDHILTITRILTRSRTRSRR